MSSSLKSEYFNCWHLTNSSLKSKYFNCCWFFFVDYSCVALRVALRCLQKRSPCLILPCALSCLAFVLPCHYLQNITSNTRITLKIAGPGSPKTRCRKMIEARYFFSLKSDFKPLVIANELPSKHITFAGSGSDSKDGDRSPSLKLKRILNPMKFLYSPDKKSFYHGCRGISLDLISFQASQMASSSTFQ